MLGLPRRLHATCSVRSKPNIEQTACSLRVCSYYILYTQVGGATPFVDSVLTVEFDDYVKPGKSFRAPLGAATCRLGPMMMLDEDEMSARLAHVAERVDIHCLSWAPAWGQVTGMESLRVTGVHCTTTVSADADVGGVPGALPLEGGAADALVAEEASGAAGEGDAFDFMELFDVPGVGNDFVFPALDQVIVEEEAEVWAAGRFEHDLADIIEEYVDDPEVAAELRGHEDDRADGDAEGAQEMLRQEQEQESVADVAPAGSGDVGGGAAVAAAAVVDEYAAMLATHGLVEESERSNMMRFSKARADGTQTRVGQINEIAGASLKATCALHPKCVCWVGRTHDRRAAVLVRLVEWFGVGVSMTPDQHSNAADQVKRDFGMRVRAKK